MRFVSVTYLNNVLRHDILNISAGTPDTKSVRNEAGTTTSRFVGVTSGNAWRCAGALEDASEHPEGCGSIPGCQGFITEDLKIAVGVTSGGFVFHFSLRALSFHPKRLHTHTRSHRSPNNSSPHLKPRHALTLSSP